MNKIEKIVTLIIAIASIITITVVLKVMYDNVYGITDSDMSPCEIELSKWRQKLIETPEDDYATFRVKQLNRTCRN